MSTRKNIYRIPAVLFLFFILTAIFTYPLVFRMSSVIPGFESTDEPYGVLWGFWLQKDTSFEQVKDTLFTFETEGGDYVSPAAYYPVWSFLIKIAMVFKNEIFAFNFFVFLSYILSGFFMFGLVYYCLRDSLAAVFSGIIYAFCPYHAVRSWQHFGLSQIHWFPLLVLSLFILYKKVNVRRILFCAGASLLFLCTEYYYSYFAFLIWLLFLVFIFLYKWKDKLKSESFSSDFKVLKASLLAGCIVCLAALPIILPILKTALFAPKTELFANAGYSRKLVDLFEQSVRPLTYILPPISHPVFGGITRNFIGSEFYGVSLTEHVVFPGWLPLLLSFFVFRKWRRRKEEAAGREAGFYVSFFILLAVASWFLSQPPWWKIGPLKILMPSFFMHKILPMFRAYCRFGLILMLAVAALAGFGLRFILGRFNFRKTKLILTCLFCGFVLFEFWTWPPYKVIDVSRVSDAHQWLKKRPDDFVIAEYPLDISSPNELYRFYQTKHGKKSINGSSPGTFLNKAIQGMARLSEEETVLGLKGLDVKYVLVHRKGYLDTGLIDDRRELDNIVKNKRLKLIESFPDESCPKDVISCTASTGPIDLYEIR